VNAVPASAPQVHWPCLALAVLLMVAGTLYPPLMTDRAGHADHVLAGLFLWATSAGFVRGVGFVPRLALLRWLLSGWACGLSISAFLIAKLVG
jgi:predicted membrane protein